MVDKQQTSRMRKKIDTTTVYIHKGKRDITRDFAEASGSHILNMILKSQS